MVRRDRNVFSGVEAFTEGVRFVLRLASQIVACSVKLSGDGERRVRPHGTVAVPLPTVYFDTGGRIDDIARIVQGVWGSVDCRRVHCGIILTADGRSGDGGSAYMHREVVYATSDGSGIRTIDRSSWQN